LLQLELILGSLAHTPAHQPVTVGSQKVTHTRKMAHCASSPMSTIQSPISSLFGSLICDEDGIYAASRALRHSSIGVTDAYYTDKRRRVTVGLDRLIRTIHGQTWGMQLRPGP
jgi:hypothetical protein